MTARDKDNRGGAKIIVGSRDDERRRQLYRNYAANARREQPKGMNSKRRAVAVHR